MKSTDDVLALIDGAMEDYSVGDGDAMRWTPRPAEDPAAAVVGAAHIAAAPMDVRVGDVVDYHGSHAVAYGLYVVAEVVGGRLALRDYVTSECELSHVRLTSVTPTGEWVPVCRCNHQLAHPLDGPTGHCPRVGCQCPHHP